MIAYKNIRKFQISYLLGWSQEEIKEYEDLIVFCKHLMI
jgi:hypothetical protein